MNINYSPIKSFIIEQQFDINYVFIIPGVLQKFSIELFLKKQRILILYQIFESVMLISSSIFHLRMHFAPNALVF